MDNLFSTTSCERKRMFLIFENAFILLGFCWTRPFPRNIPQTKSHQKHHCAISHVSQKRSRERCMFSLQKSVSMFQHRFLGDVFRLDPVTKAATGCSEKDDHCFTGHGTREGQVWLVCRCFIQVGGIRYVFIYIRFPEG